MTATTIFSGKKKRELRRKFLAIAKLRKRLGNPIVPRDDLERRLGIPQKPPQDKGTIAPVVSAAKFDPPPFIKLDSEGRVRQQFARDIRGEVSPQDIQRVAEPAAPLEVFGPYLPTQGETVEFDATADDRSLLVGGYFDAPSGKFNGEFASYGYDSGAATAEDVAEYRTKRALPVGPMRPAYDYDSLRKLAFTATLSLYTSSWSYKDRKGVLRHFPASTIRVYRGKPDYSEIEDIADSVCATIMVGGHDRPAYLKTIENAEHRLRAEIKGLVKRELFARLKNRVRSVDHDKLFFIEQHVQHGSSVDELSDEEFEAIEQSKLVQFAATVDWKVVRNLPNGKEKVVRTFPAMSDAEGLRDKLGGEDKGYRIRSVKDNRDVLGVRLLSGGYTAAEAAREIDVTRNVFESTIRRAKARLKPYFEEGRRVPKETKVPCKNEFTLAFEAIRLIRLFDKAKARGEMI